MTYKACDFSTPKIMPDDTISMKRQQQEYKNIPFYHLWLPAFFDSNDDGIGDIKGVICKLDYLADLGIKGIWLSPFFECGYKGKRMHGYDVTNFYEVNPLLGTKEDLKELLCEAHLRKIQIIFDFPMNHTSQEHPWFLDSKNNGQFRDWYVWNDSPGSGWQPIWDEARTKQTWHSHEESNYYGVFSKMMPDLNFENREVRDEIAHIIAFWLNFGFDGVRIDGARYIYEDGPNATADTERTHQIFKLIRSKIFNEYEKLGYAKVMIAEAWGAKEIVAHYYGKNDEFHSCFNFSLAGLIPLLIDGDAKKQMEFMKTINYQLATYPQHYLGGLFLTNHDLAGNRPATEFRGDSNKMLLAFALQLYLPGTPFIYYGNELGMKNSRDSGDLKLRTTMEWKKAKDSNKLLQAYKIMLEDYNNDFENFQDEKATITMVRDAVLVIKRMSVDKTILFLANISRKKLTLAEEEIKAICVQPFHTKEKRKNITLSPFSYEIFRFDVTI